MVTYFLLGSKRQSLHCQFTIKFPKFSDVILFFSSWSSLIEITLSIQDNHFMSTRFRVIGHVSDLPKSH